MSQSLKRLSQNHNNDYTALEATYRTATGSELVLDPYRSIFNTEPELTLSASSLSERKGVHPFGGLSILEV